MPFAPNSRLVSRHHGLPDSSAFLKPMCGRHWHRTNQGGEVAARTMSAEIPPVRCCGGGGRTGRNFQMENRPARDGSQATATEIGAPAGLTRARAPGRCPTQSLPQPCPRGSRKSVCGGRPWRTIAKERPAGDGAPAAGLSRRVGGLGHPSSACRRHTFAAKTRGRACRRGRGCEGASAHPSPSCSGRCSMSATSRRTRRRAN